jgi:sugar lactone lactonase YvrE
MQEGRFSAGIAPRLTEGWHLERLTPPSRLFGANGLRTGPDGRIYIAQVTGSQISALDVETGRLQTISPKGGDIVAPDDVAFDSRGNLYATEVMDTLGCYATTCRALTASPSIMAGCSSANVEKADAFSSST